MAAHKPIQASGLRILSGPISPASPLSPLRAQLHFPNLPSPRLTPPSPSFNKSPKTLGAPPDAMPWIWSCHKCHTKYLLGATRRCLHDGHYFCGGTTIDKKTGKTKRHRACASEFDYIGWEDFRSWRRRLKEQKSPGRTHTNCEKQCDFPSACHWKTRHTPLPTANFSFLDSSCLGTELSPPHSPSPSFTPSKTTTRPALKKGTQYIDKIVKAAEKRTTQLTTLLSTIEEENNFASMVGYIPAITENAGVPKLPEIPGLNGLGLIFPVLDFSGFGKAVEQTQPQEMRGSSIPGLFASTTTASSLSDSDVNMTNALPSSNSTNSANTSPPIFPLTSSPTTTAHHTTVSPLTSNPPSPPVSPLTPSPTSTQPPSGFDFGHGSKEDEGSVLPRRDGWGWDLTGKGIGIALGSPTRAGY